MCTASQLAQLYIKVRGDQQKIGCYKLAVELCSYGLVLTYGCEDGVQAPQLKPEALPRNGPII